MKLKTIVLVVCEQHGNGFMFVCPHVATAISNGSACRDIRHLDFKAPHDEDLADLTLDGWFCNHCVEEHQLPIDGFVADADSFLDNTNDIFRPMCPGCFEDWRARMN